MNGLGHKSRAVHRHVNLCCYANLYEVGGEVGMPVIEETTITMTQSRTRGAGKIYCSLFKARLLHHLDNGSTVFKLNLGSTALVREEIQYPWYT